LLTKEAPIYRDKAVFCLTETLLKSRFCGTPAPLCDAGICKIKGLAPLRSPHKLPGFCNQRFRNHAAKPWIFVVSWA
jgi:hypothetical protein